MFRLALQTMFTYEGRKRIKEWLFVALKIDYFKKRIYSQEGEDLFVINFFPENFSGAYLDIGAHHPLLYSNTALLYAKGWKGVNIDAFPGSMKVFRKVRKRDINLEVGVAFARTAVHFYVFKEKGINTFSKEIAEYQQSKGKKLEKVIEVQCMPVVDILRAHWNNKTLNFVSIDIEGLEMDVFRSFDFSLYKPELFCIEFIEADINDVLESDINRVLEHNGYKLIARLGNSHFFSIGGKMHLR